MRAREWAAEQTTRAATGETLETPDRSPGSERKQQQRQRKKMGEEKISGLTSVSNEIPRQPARNESEMFTSVGCASVTRLTTGPSSVVFS